MEHSQKETHTGPIIPGWGMDADLGNRPAYPMRDYDADSKGGMDWARPPMQNGRTEILHSTERPGLSAAYGTPHPPRGLSGAIRRMAFRRSEGQWSHWLLLILADRIDMIEGIFQDIASGHFPDFFGEMGLRSEIKYNRRGFYKKIFVSIATIALMVAVIMIDMD